MFNRLPITCLLLASAVLMALSSGAQTVSNTVNVNFTFTLINSSLANVRSLTITPLKQFGNYSWPGQLLPHTPLPPSITLPDPITFSVARYPQMTNGSVQGTNIWTGIPYQLAAATPWTIYYFTNYFDTNETGTVDASTNQAFVFGAIILPRGANGTNGANGSAGTGGNTNLTWGILTNLSDSTNKLQTHWIYPTPPYNFSNHPYALNTTNQ